MESNKSVHEVICCVCKDSLEFDKANHYSQSYLMKKGLCIPSDLHSHKHCIPDFKGLLKLMRESGY